MLRSLFVFVVGVGALCAQGFSFNAPFDPALIRYLDLTSDQVSRIEANNRELQARFADQQRRLFTLISEAQAELTKTSPDPMVVGSRYAEQESICRSQTGATGQTRERNRAVLTETQRQRLVALQEASRLASVVNEAQAANLYRPPQVDVASFLLGGVSSFPAGLVSGGLIGIDLPRNGCGLGFGSNVIPISRIGRVLP